MSCGISRKRHNESTFCESDIKNKIMAQHLSTNSTLCKTTSNASSRRNHSTSSRTGCNASSSSCSTPVVPARTPVTRQLAMATRRTLAGVTPLSRRKAEKESQALPKTPNVYMSPVGRLYQNEGGKENLYESIASCDVKVDPQARHMERLSSCNQMSLRGKLNISVALNKDLLTVHIIGARKLQSLSEEACNSFVEVSMVPIQCSKPTLCQTKVVHDTNTPQFDQKFTYELPDSARQQRLLVSLWNKTPTGQELIGCMSFGLRNLVHKWKYISGWYYLLKEELGRSKHLRVNQQPAMINPSSSMVPQTPTVQKLSFLLKPSSEGFGFNVTGCHPVVISSVCSQSGADAAGLRPGDRISHVNGQNVARSTAYTVTQLISKMTTSGLDIHVLRPSINTTIPESLAPSLPWCRTPSGASDIASSVCMTAKSSIDSLLAPAVPPSCCSRPTSLNVDMKLAARLEADFGTVDDGSIHAKRSKCDGASDNGRHGSLESLPVSIKPAKRSTSSDKYHTPTKDSHYRQANVALSESTSKVPALHEILRCEQRYVDEMQFGLERFSRPLLHNMLSAYEHSKLFNNVEKIVAISDFCMQQLQQICEDMESETPTRRRLSSRDLSSVLNVYTQRLSLICEAYSVYCTAIPSSMRLLTRLQSNSKLCHFQQTPPVPEGLPNLTEFISRPHQHIEDLLSLFEEISTSLCNGNERRNGDLMDIIEGLRGCIPASSDEEYDQFNTSNCDLLEYGFMENDSLDGETHIQEYCSSPETTSSDDVLSRVSFCNVTNPTSRVALGDCHLVHMSDVVYANGWQWNEMVLLLLDDILLLAECLPDGLLSVKHDPIPVSTILECDLNCYHPCEFSVNTKSRTYVFRTRDTSQKVRWCDLLSGDHHNSNNIKKTNNTNSSSQTNHKSEQHL